MMPSFLQRARRRLSILPGRRNSTRGAEEKDGLLLPLKSQQQHSIVPSPVSVVDFDQRNNDNDGGEEDYGGDTFSATDAPAAVERYETLAVSPRQTPTEAIKESSPENGSADEQQTIFFSNCNSSTSTPVDHCVTATVSPAVPAVAAEPIDESAMAAVVEPKRVDDDDDDIVSEPSPEHSNSTENTVVEQEQPSFETSNPTSPEPERPSNSSPEKLPVRQLALYDSSPSVVPEFTTSTIINKMNAPLSDSKPTQTKQLGAVPVPPPPPAAAAVPLPPPRRSDKNVDILGKRVEIIAGVNKKHKFAIIEDWKNENTLQVRIDNSNSGSANGTVVNVRNTSIQIQLQPSPLDVSVDDQSSAGPSRGVEDKENILTHTPPKIANRKNMEGNKEAQTVMNRSPLCDVVQAPCKVTALTLNTAKQVSPDLQSTEPVQPDCSDPRVDSSNSGKNGLLFQRVKITKGDKKHKGKLGTITNDDDKRSIKVMLDEGGAIVGKALSSLEIIGSSPNHSDDAGNAPSQQQNNASTEQSSKTRKRISPPIGTLRQKYNILSPRIPRPRRSAVAASTTPTSPSTTPKSGIAWRVPDFNRGGMMFGSRRVAKIRLHNNGAPAKQEITFLYHLLGDRVILTEEPLSGRSDQKPFDKTIQERGSTYELVSAKVYDDKDQGSSEFCKPKLVRLMYAQVEGKGMESFSIDETLLNVGDFSILNPRKIMARLELFQSPAKFNIVFLPSHDFQNIEDKGYVGCGFVSDERLVQICLDGGMSKAHASRVVAIQVRLFIPTMGIYKGMLVRSPVVAESNGPGAGIQLPASMLKVLKSSSPDALQDAAILVCKNGIHPSPGSANEYIGRRLDPNRKNPPEKSFKAQIKKPLSDMVFRLWKTLGVPDDVCNKYKKESLKTSGRNHAWLVGVADPTGSLPPDHIFIPGTQRLEDVDEFFVTRSPCVKAEDGRMLPVVKSLPESMSEVHWEWLNALPFGCIIFSNPRPGMLSIPERIASGDLDGDLYLVCFDEQVLSYIQAEPLVDEPSEDNYGAAAAPSMMDHDPQWFQHAQDLMIDAALVNDMGRLTGTLYTKATKIADDKKNADVVLRHTDSIALMEAYNLALEFKKHGGMIKLPSHLHEKVPANLRKYLTV